jgi:hypothetical protein
VHAPVGLLVGGRPGSSGARRPSPRPRRPGAPAATARRVALARSRLSSMSGGGSEMRVGGKTSPQLIRSATGLRNVARPTLLGGSRSSRPRTASLRDLFGLGREDRAVSATAWEPTPFPAEGPPLVSRVIQRSSPQQKVELFRALFPGRDDAYALRWENGRTDKSGWGPAVKGGWANSETETNSWPMTCRRSRDSGRSVPTWY